MSLIATEEETNSMNLPLRLAILVIVIFGLLFTGMEFLKAPLQTQDNPESSEY